MGPKRLLHFLQYPNGNPQLTIHILRRQERRCPPNTQALQKREMKLPSHTARQPGDPRLLHREGHTQPSHFHTAGIWKQGVGDGCLSGGCREAPRPSLALLFCAMEPNPENPGTSCHFIRKSTVQNLWAVSKVTPMIDLKKINSIQIFAGTPRCGSPEGSRPPAAKTPAQGAWSCPEACLVGKLCRADSKVYYWEICSLWLRVCV